MHSLTTLEEELCDADDEGAEFTLDKDSDEDEIDEKGQRGTLVFKNTMTMVYGNNNFPAVQ